MRINDRVYGIAEITEPLLLKLINSKPVQRLKRVQQFAPEGPWKYPFKSFSRYEHSIGVTILLKRLDASLIEQAAGLLNDSSHLAFGHIAEWALGYHNEDYHDKIFNEILEKIEIAKILKQHEINPDELKDFEGFKLLEQPTPKLCADRVDYVLRELAFIFDLKKAQELASHVVNFNNTIAFNSKEAAKAFGLYFLKFQTEHWGSPQVATFYRLLADAMKVALDSRELTLNDLKKTDEEISRILLNSKLPKVKEILALLINGFSLVESKSPQIKLKKKFRHADPTYVLNGRAYSLIETDKEFTVEVERHRKVNEKGINVEVVAE